VHAITQCTELLPHQANQQAAAYAEANLGPSWSRVAIIYTPATTDTEPSPPDLALPHRPSKRRQPGSFQTGTARQRRSIEQMHRLTSSYLLKVFPRSKSQEAAKTGGLVFFSRKPRQPRGKSPLCSLSLSLSLSLSRPHSPIFFTHYLRACSLLDGGASQERTPLFGGLGPLLSR
jgi:hypothetical protein